MFVSSYYYLMTNISINMVDHNYLAINLILLKNIGEKCRYTKTTRRYKYTNTT